MINNTAFIERLEEIFNTYSVTASQFADTIGVQRSAVSHILSARNKPSLDFVLKIIQHYPETDLHWLLFGKECVNAQQRAAAPAPTLTKEEKEAVPEKESQINNIFTSAEDIEQIVVFYKSGQFKAYHP